jgi:glycosyltransferase involved in cell wall biosynthesis
MTSSTAVAVVIPCYRQAHLLGEALESCLEQEPPPTEIIVVDDGSPDDVRAAVAAFDDPRIRLVRRSNGGLSAARNTGLVASTSPLIVFLDADDTLRPGALAAGLACHAAHPAAAFVWGGFQNMDANGRPFGRAVVRRPRRAPFIEITIGNIIGMHGAVMYRRAPLIDAGGFDEALRTVEDWDMYLRLAKEHPVSWHDGIVANYRRHGNTITGDYDGMLRGGLTMLEHFRPSIGEAPALVRAWSLGRARFVGRNLRKALLAGLRGLRQGHFRPLLRAIRTVVRYTWFLLPSPRPGFAVRAVARQVLQTRPAPANG